MKIDYAAQCRFFSAEDACRLALASYFAAGRRIEPPPGESWLTDGEPWASAADFVDAFSGEMQARIALLALDRLGNFNAASSQWNLYQLAADVEPEKMAPIIAAREAEWEKIKAEVEAQFSPVEMNHLPPSDNAVHSCLEQGGENGF